uniref:Uncharacterized protein n=1 Tax=Timema bartmani TaxID=61472 RepID=A0A7R9FD95_9NEOP|nr:unnamed protein product [Timema bartmani]
MRPGTVLPPVVAADRGLGTLVLLGLHEGQVHLEQTQHFQHLQHNKITAMHAVGVQYSTNDFFKRITPAELCSTLRNTQHFHLPTVLRAGVSEEMSR